MFLSENLRKVWHEKYFNKDYDLLEKDLSDKKFFSLKPTNKLPESNTSEFVFDELLEEDKDIEEDLQDLNNQSKELDSEQLKIR